MAAFNPNALKSVSAVADLGATGKRTARDVVLEGIKQQLKLLADPKVEGRRWFRSGVSDTAFSIRYGNTALKLRGQETQLAVETKSFSDALNYFSDEIAKGKFDDQLAELEKARATRTDKMRETRAAKKGQKTS
ncbi:hypothetical protein [Sphingobium bisphenolivorans]|uniref:hypothetical protein n=1 Tax=Sphingobium bisphenolivorans TaxID=1335760 RepID=UPI0003A3D5F3|nr:hypothetical protein [Sphingobium bisphenolivorans]